ncbi:MAG: O-antigen ligase family protein [Marinifilaceae bacterium]|nr:O-antigen ligase family protein [Marinifilaceae bacterium]
MQRTKLLKIPFVELLVAGLVILLPLANSSDLMFGIQTAKSFGFFYGLLVLVGFSAIGFLFRNREAQLKITIIDLLLVAFVGWVTLNKYVFHDVRSFSLGYFELLGLCAFYFIVRAFKPMNPILLMVAICMGGAVQAVYGNLQLWGYFSSHHGIFKLTGSFFNPGPFAGYLCGILSIALGLYWMFDRKKYEKQLKSIKEQLVNIKTKSLFADLKSLIPNLQPVILKSLGLITLLSILLVLPAARSRAAWLGAIAGVVFLVWHKFNLIQYFKLRNGQAQCFKFFNRSVQIRNGVWVALLLVAFAVGSWGLYHYKKDSADGRMLIWKVAAHFIADYPILGVGHDRFKAHYMDYQADYFREHPNSKFELVADDNQYAFNEPLHVWAENGLIGILLATGIVFSVFFTPLRNFRLQVSGSKLTEPETCNLKPETKNLKSETILRASLLSIGVFGLFAYPSEILPIKFTVFLCLALLAGMVRPVFTMSLHAQRKAVQSVLLRLPVSIATLTLLVWVTPRIQELQGAYKTWKDAFDLYNYNLYSDCLEDYERAYPMLRNNGEFLINYGKALSIAENHTKAIEVLEQARKYQPNTILYTAMGDSYKGMKKCELAESHYWQASHMAPVKFYPLYLLAKLYDESGQQAKAVEMAKSVLSKDVKVESTAIKEIKDEMQEILHDEF